MDFQAFYQLSYGLYIITSVWDNKKNGFIGNTVFQVTSKPPTMAISVNKENYTHDIIAESKFFAVSVLTRNTSMDIIRTFGYNSGKDMDKFANVTVQTSENGLPLVLNDTSALFECRVIKTVDAGTHTLFIGEILSAELVQPNADPLTYKYYREVHKGKAPAKAPTFIDETDIKAGEEIYTCQICHYQYKASAGDPDHGIAPGTSFEDLPDDWTCPVCGATKDLFEKN
ncbi:flavin reductase [candidate division KSB1 bacterium]|nr:flavin reductase [candidate division KSB1 bacterium]